MIIHDQKCLIYIQKHLQTNVCSQTLLNHGHLVRLEVSPGLSTCLPPYTSVAPSFTPSSQYSTSLSRWALWFWGPWSVERSKGSPIFIFLISSTWAQKNPPVCHHLEAARRRSFTINMFEGNTHHSPDVLVMNGLLDKQPACSNTVFSLVEVNRAHALQRPHKHTVSSRRLWSCICDCWH